MIKTYRNSCILFLLLFKCASSIPIIAETDLKEITEKKDCASDIIVRILLETKPINGTGWKIASSGKDSTIRMYDPANPEKRYLLQGSSLEFIYNAAYGWVVKNRMIPFTTICLEAVEGQLTFDGSPYPGVLFLQVHENNLLIINHVPLETYIESVLHTESWPGWPLEVNKAFAIASRSYTVTRLVEPNRFKKPFDIQCTNKHQTYSGLLEKERLHEAVEQTKGLILTHNKRPIEAMFDTCCGGIIPKNMEGVNFKKAPYLARATECTFCSSSKVYQWKFSCTLQDLEVKIKQSGMKLIGTLQKVWIKKKDKAGIVHSITVKAGNKLFEIAARSLYAWFQPIKSSAYSIEQKGKELYFTGKGYGHHLGICQWGARNMLDVGKNFVSILYYYYPGSSLAVLSL